MDAQCWLQLVLGGECLLRFVKAFVRWSSLWPQVQQQRTTLAWSAPASEIHSSTWKGSRDLAVIFIFLVALSVRRVGQLSSIHSCTAYLYVYVFLTSKYMYV